MDQSIFKLAGWAVQPGFSAVVRRPESGVAVSASPQLSITSTTIDLCAHSHARFRRLRGTIIKTVELRTISLKTRWPTEYMYSSIRASFSIPFSGANDHNAQLLGALWSTVHSTVPNDQCTSNANLRLRTGNAAETKTLWLAPVQAAPKSTSMLRQSSLSPRFTELTENEMGAPSRKVQDALPFAIGALENRSD